ncbi:MAG: beta-galactosidase [Bacteroidota bacterium]|nr:beta-galactosidase [Bacteroidota bacterium]
MKRLSVIVLFLFLIQDTLSAQVRVGVHHFGFQKDQFVLDQQPFQIISGEMHPARIPREYWRQRIRMAKAMGCNTIAAYIFWNYQEPRKGFFDFTSSNHDVAAFIRICQEEKMWVLLRPGPYVCAEWDLGGIPSYLLSIPDIKLRCSDPRYLNAADRYIQQLAAQVKGLQCTAGGPILMVQIENEYGSYGNDKDYLHHLANFWRKQGINVPFYTSDGATPYMLDAGNILEAAIGLDSGSSDRDFAEATRHNPNVPSFSGETYPGWLTHWGEKWARTDTNELKKEIGYLLSHKKSFNLYVVHGGTNFGYSAGANAFSPTQYQPDITSYDYDAPINEQGRVTPKYFMLRRLIGAYLQHPLMPVPQPVNTIQIPEIKMQWQGSVWQHLPVAIHSAQPLTMEALQQNQGMVLYRTQLIGHKSGKLTITEPHDFGLVFLNGIFIDSVWRDGGKWTVNLPQSDVKDPVLEILMEGMGHINFAQYMIDRKGITERVTLNGMTLMNWDMFALPMQAADVAKMTAGPANQTDDRPGKLFTGTFQLSETGDTFLDMQAYRKGMVYVNGHLLGRYWNKGPQQRLYCPATFLHKGENAIQVFDFFQKTPAVITGKETME